MRRMTIHQIINMTLDEVESLFVADRLSFWTYKRFLVLWSWSASRFGGYASYKQDKFRQEHGYEALIKRRELVKRLAERVMNRAR